MWRKGTLSQRNKATKIVGRRRGWTKFEKKGINNTGGLPKIGG